MAGIGYFFWLQSNNWYDEDELLVYFTILSSTGHIVWMGTWYDLRDIDSEILLDISREVRLACSEHNISDLVDLDDFLEAFNIA